MNIAVIGGTGKEGSGLAMRWAHAGHTVVIGSRDAAKAQVSAAELNASLETAGSNAPKTSGLDNLTAAQNADVVVLSVPYSAHEGTIASILPALAGKVVIDVAVPINPTDFLRVSVPKGGSASKEAQTQIGDAAKVVAAFQNISATHLKKLEEKVDCDVLVCGDDAAAKQVVLGLVKDCGMTGWDAGPLDNAVVVEGLTPVLLGINKRHKVKGAGLRITLG